MFNHLIKVNLEEVYGESAKGGEFIYRKPSMGEFMAVRDSQENGSMSDTGKIIDQVVAECFISGTACDEKEMKEVDKEMYQKFFMDYDLSSYVMEKMQDNQGLKKDKPTSEEQ